MNGDDFDALLTSLKSIANQFRGKEFTSTQIFISVDCIKSEDLSEDIKISLCNTLSKKMAPAISYTHSNAEVERIYNYYDKLSLSVAGAIISYLTFIKSQPQDTGSIDWIYLKSILPWINDGFNLECIDLLFRRMIN